MRHIVKPLVMVLFIVLLGCGENPESSAATFPSMNLEQLTSKVEASAGRVVVVNLWATWCGPCRMELGQLTQLRERYSQDQLLMLGLSVDQNRDDVRAFFGAKTMNYPIYHADNDVPATFDARGVPHFLIFDKNGKLAYNQGGYLSVEQLSGAVDELLHE